jgi:hypothetical protein
VRAGRFAGAIQPPAFNPFDAFAEAQVRRSNDGLRRALTLLARLSARRPLGPRDGIVVRDLGLPFGCGRNYQAVVAHGDTWAGPLRAWVHEAVDDLVAELDGRLRGGDADALDRERDGEPQARRV